METRAEIKAALSGRPADAVLSDMHPHATGDHFTDHMSVLVRKSARIQPLISDAAFGTDGTTLRNESAASRWALYRKAHAGWRWYCLLLCVALSVGSQRTCSRRR